MAKEGGGSSGSKGKSQRKTIKKKELLSDELKQNLVAVFNGIEEAEESIASLPESSKGDLTCHMISIKDSVCNLASGLLRKGITTKNDVIKTMSTKGESSKSASKKAAVAAKKKTVPLKKRKDTPQKGTEVATASKSEITQLLKGKIQQFDLNKEFTILNKIAETDSVAKIVATEFGYHSKTKIKDELKSNVVIMLSSHKKNIHKQRIFGKDAEVRLPVMVRRMSTTLLNDIESRGWTTSLAINGNETKSDYIVFLPQSVHDEHMSSEPIEMALADNYHEGTQEDKGTHNELFGDSSRDEGEDPADEIQETVHEGSGSNIANKPSPANTVKKDGEKSAGEKLAQLNEEDEAKVEEYSNETQSPEKTSTTEGLGSGAAGNPAPHKASSAKKTKKKQSPPSKSSSPAGKPQNNAVAKSAAEKKDGGKHAGEKRIRDDEAEKGTPPKKSKGEEPSPSRRKSPRSGLKTESYKDQL
jgi:hypothetical protein